MNRAGSYATFYVGKFFFGIPIAVGVEVTKGQEVTPVPLGPKEVAGFFNLRGQIVTAINMRTRLNLSQDPNDADSLSIFFQDQDHLFALLVDRVGDFTEVTEQTFEETPSNLDSNARELIVGVHKLADKLLLVLDTHKIVAGIDLVQN
ncbi:chemotaxis protein CheW [Polynucleobacter paneuropaeus]|uniref:Chemotaxis protein CheW n=1 Tax=Polynucleobacter paneuropaeus TaxID=2527775 RepID=A0AAE3CGP7_9BURK|nr:chemotaxis protein CheW [Polynucleobacter paneuropaeus]MBT8590442.1 chemotaxis protein CheW [Polynucleobacter paneuropaeus]MBT8595818.1 chemotaxis protein CheW [Polynucleobacter paneuropaeus]MBT8597645.1 chemotaxis protein CheW [Polynucleobacter paneuropaeus]